MSSNMNQGNYDPTQPAQPSTLYGNNLPYGPIHPYALPPPPPPKNTRPLIIGLVVVVVVLLVTVGVLIGLFVGHQSPSTATSPAATSVPKATIVVPTQMPTVNKIPSPIPSPTFNPTPTPIPVTPTTQPVSQPTASCPTSTNDAASRYGGNPGSWKQLARGEWFYQNGNQPLQNVTFKNTIHVDWWDNFNAHNGGPGDVTVPFASQLTLYCNPG